MYFLRTFGRLAIERQGTPLDGLVTHRKSLAVLAVLAAQGSTSRDRVMALLWSDSTAARARGSLKQSIHLLRRRLGAPDLVLGSSELRLNAERIDCDRIHFMVALRENNDERAVRMYQGPFLDGVHVDGAPEFERWVDSERRELERQYQDALERLARSAEASADHSRAAAWWSRLQAVDPLSSRVALHLIEAFEAAGDRAAALRHAHIHQTLLQEELGISVDSAIAEAVQRIRASGAALPPPLSSAPGPERTSTPTATPRTAPAATDLDGPAYPPLPAAASPVAAPDDTPSFAVRSGPIDRKDPVGPRHGGRKAGPVSFVVLLASSAAVLVLVEWAANLGAPIRLPRPNGGDHGVANGTAIAIAAPVIAVLPFSSSMAEAEDEYFGAGITEEILTQLAHLGDLSVIARASARHYGNSEQSTREIAEELGASHLVTGSVWRQHDRVRITSQLTDASTGRQLWAETFDRDIRDIFEIQTEVARRIAESLHDRLSGRSRTPTDRPPTANVAAYDLLLRARELDGTVRDRNTAAIGLLWGAIRLDTTFALAYAELAERFAERVAIHGADESADSGAVMALRAISLQPDLAAGFGALSWNLWRMGQLHRAREAGIRAVELDPNAASAMSRLSWVERLLGNHEASVRWAKRGFRLNPRWAYPPNSIGYGYMLVGDFEEAERWFDRTLELEPGFVWAHRNRVQIDLYRGRTGAARSRTEAMLTRDPFNVVALSAAGEVEAAEGDWRQASVLFQHAYDLAPDAVIHISLRFLLAQAMLRAGQEEHAARLLDQVLETARSRLELGNEEPRLLFEIAAVHALRGNRDEAVDWLDRAIDSGWTYPTGSGIWLPFELLHDDPTFVATIQRMESDLALMRERL